MLGEDKNIKDSNLEITPSIKDSHFPVSYNKPNKLITALYMVTDIMDVHEPLRNKLRNLGTEIISDIHSVPLQATNKITQVMSFLDIAFTMKLISEMNCRILKKEFAKLEHSLKEYGQVKSVWLEEFLTKSPDVVEEEITSQNSPAVLPSRNISIGHAPSSRTSQVRARIGVQKGSTLMKALSDKNLSQITKNPPVSYQTPSVRSNFDLLKKQRREDIIRIIKSTGDGSTITDIKTKAQGPVLKSESLISCGEKTLQRELVSMVKDGVLNKTGEKRWSRYFIKA